MGLSGTVAAHFEKQADSCDRLGSPFTASLCRLLIELIDEKTATGRRVLNWPGDARADALALRVCGGLHRLVIEQLDPALAQAYPPHEAGREMLAEAVAGALARHDETLLAVLDSAPQTNEIARSAMLLPGFLAIAREAGLPLALCEIGSSGGLNLLFDRFFYDYGRATWGDPASPVKIAPELRSATLPLDGILDVTSRQGCDIAPVDVSAHEGRLRLRSYLWPDQPLRLARLDGALALAGRHPFSLVKSDAGAFVRERLAKRAQGEAFVVFHSIMWQYMPRETKDDILAALGEAGGKASAAAPLYRLRMEPLGPHEGWATLSLTSWPGGETRRLAGCDFHGRWIEWLGG